MLNVTIAEARVGLERGGINYAQATLKEIFAEYPDCVREYVQVGIKLRDMLIAAECEGA
jgi:hypothetical protein